MALTFKFNNLVNDDAATSGKRVEHPPGTLAVNTVQIDLTQPVVVPDKCSCSVVVVGGSRAFALDRIGAGAKKKGFRANRRHYRTQVKPDDKVAKKFSVFVSKRSHARKRVQVQFT